MAPWDKDYQFMAITDLLMVLKKKNVNLDAESEAELVRALLKLLNDQHSEIQNLTVKCLRLLINKVHECQVVHIVKSLCYNMVYEKEELQIISNIGLKAIIAELPQKRTNFSGNICNIITVELTKAIQEQADFALQIEVLDIMSDLLLRFGSTIQTYHEDMLLILLLLLFSEHRAVRKRAIIGCSNFVLSCDSELFSVLIYNLSYALRTYKDNSDIETYVQCVAVVCREANYKFGEHLEKFVPLILQCINIDNDEIREYCLQAFESFIATCPSQMHENIPALTELCLEYIVYDPNYNFDGEESENSENNSHNEDEEDEEYNDDDDDMSWRVRKTSVKCLEAIIFCMLEILPEFFYTLSPVLISRFNKEREENVKSVIFHAYITLLKKLQPTIRINYDQNSNTDDTEFSLVLLEEQIKLLINEVQGQIRAKSMRTRQDCLQLLKEVFHVLPECLSTHIGVIIPGILYSLSDESASRNMKIYVLSFIYYLLKRHQPQVFHSHISILLPPVISAVGDNFYKITVEALNVLKKLVTVIRPLDIYCDFDFTPFIKDIYSCTLLRLRTINIDQEVKENAISTMGQVVCNLGDHLKSELPNCLSLFLDRLKNETTRLTTVKALYNIAGSPLSIDLPVIPDIMPILALTLRKNQRALKLNTLNLIYRLIKNYPNNLTIEILDPFVIEIPQLLDESDLDVARWTLRIINSVAVHHPEALKKVNNTIMSQVCLLVKFPLLEGTALISVLELLQIFSIM